VCSGALAKVELVRARRFYIYRELFLPHNNRRRRRRRNRRSRYSGIPIYSIIIYIYIRVFVFRILTLRYRTCIYIRPPFNSADIIDCACGEGGMSSSPPHRPACTRSPTGAAVGFGERVAHTQQCRKSEILNTQYDNNIMSTYDTFADCNTVLKFSPACADVHYTPPWIVFALYYIRRI